MLFPDAANFADELDKYRQQSESLDALRDRVLDPVLWATFGSGKPFCPDYSAVTDDGAAGLLDHGGADLGVLQRPDRSRGGRIHAGVCRAPRFEEVIQGGRTVTLARWEAVAGDDAEPHLPRAVFGAVLGKKSPWPFRAFSAGSAQELDGWQPT